MRQRARFMRSCAWCIVCAGSGLVLPVNALAQFSMDAYAFDSIGTSGNACSRISASVAQAAPGFSSGGSFDLSAGFQAIVAASPGDAIFFDGFEGCRP